MSQALVERSLVELARSGDLEAFESLVRCRMDAVYRLSLAILGDEAEAADAAQETFVSVWRQVGKLRDAERFEPWLQRIAVNACRETMRGRRRRHLREIPMSRVEGGVDERPNRAANDTEVLRSALRRLPLDQRSILAMHHLEGRPIAEIAEALSIPAGTAKSRLFAARAALEKALREEASS